MTSLLNSNNITNFDFVEAVDGSQLILDDGIVKLFEGNDFGNRRSMIGCAKSHLNIWIQLLFSKHDYYLILEDDIELNCNKEKLENIFTHVENNLQSIDFLYLGYTMHRNNEYIKKNVSDTFFVNMHTSGNIDNYIGGFFSYIITKNGAMKMLDYITKNGIKHGIDYVVKKVPNLNMYNCQPHLITTDWVDSIESNVNSDIQKDFVSFDFNSYKSRKSDDNWDYYPGLDSIGDDIMYESTDSGNYIDKMKEIANTNPSCVGFNTLGFMKSKINYPLQTSPYITSDHGLFVKKNKKFSRIKLLCNWCTSEQLCKEWNNLTKGNNTWHSSKSNILFTWEDTDIDFYIIINKPLYETDKYDPKRTILFHMEPWVDNMEHNWGVKTWGIWAEPDENKFLQVRSHKNFYNNAFWQLSSTWVELKNNNIEKSKGNLISSICSSKYYDPGHIKRIDFLKYLENNYPDIGFDLYNSDNNHNFKSYRGKVTPNIDKENGIMPYKYYFMCENNAEYNFITEKLWEPILCETLCFYWGCPNVSDYINPMAYVQLNMDDFEESVKIIKNAIHNNLWEERLPFIKQEKEKILNYYSFCPTVERVLFEDFKFTPNPTNEEIIYKKHFDSLEFDKKQVCFIHSCNLGDTTLYNKLIDTIKLNGLYDKLDYIIVCNIGQDIIDTINSKVKIINYSSDTSLYEIPTLKLMHYFSSLHSEMKILYLHTKGVSYNMKSDLYSNITDWIDCMLYFLTNKHIECLDLLESFDTIGINYLGGQNPHYSGNFWWTTSKYISTLNVDKLTDKMSAEWWLLSNNKVNKYNMYHSNIDHYMNSYKPPYLD